jgi:phosphoglycolate phosphatase
MTRAFEDLFGVPDALARLSLAGRTDSWVLHHVAERHGVHLDADIVGRFHETYLVHLSEEIHRPGPRKGILPGVPPLLEAITVRDRNWLALLTGNLERGARIKLEYFGLWRHFECGAFGDHAAERNDLLAQAVRRAEASGLALRSAADIVVVGDTPLDVAVAASGGARAVGVATGDYPVDELRAAGADAVVSDFSDLSAALEAIGIA